ncbi:MAG: glycosyltransferase [Pirellulales bacterium]
MTRVVESQPVDAAKDAAAPPVAVRVAYLVNQYPQPSQSFIRREIAALEQQGVEVDRFTLRRGTTQLVDPADRKEAERTRAILDVGVVGLVLAALRTAVSHLPAFWRALRLACRVGRRSDRGLQLHLVYLAEACVLRQWLATGGVSHVHAHFGTNSTTVAMLCHALSGPAYSFTVHGPEEFDKPEFLGLGEKIRRASFVVAISQFGRSQLFRWCEYEHWEKVRVVRCGVDDAFLRAVPTSPPSEPRLACVARLSEQKGVPLLIEAAARLASEGVRFELVLVGDGPMRPEIERLIAQSHLQDRVRLVGWKSNAEVRETLRASRALVLPSFAEGLPVVIMEALAMHRPVISTQVAGIAELVIPGECGWIVPAGAVDPLVAAMREAVEYSPDRLAEMGAAGALRVSDNHNAHHEAAKLAALFRASR